MSNTHGISGRQPFLPPPPATGRDGGAGTGMPLGRGVLPAASALLSLVPKRGFAGTQNRCLRGPQFQHRCAVRRSVNWCPPFIQKYQEPERGPGPGPGCGGGCGRGLPLVLSEQCHGSFGILLALIQEVLPRRHARAELSSIPLVSPLPGSLPASPACARLLL